MKSKACYFTLLSYFLNIENFSCTDRNAILCSMYALQWISYLNNLQILTNGHLNIETLKKFHSKIIFNPGLSATHLFPSNRCCLWPSNGYYQLFDKIHDRNVNVMIRSYVNNKFYQDANFVYLACFGFHNLRGQIDDAVGKKGLDSDLFIRNCIV
ncbi:hypothetical protein H5410_016980, partial [Solanum commersonii]